MSTRSKENRVAAVIELGSTSVRMAVGQLDREGKLQILDSLEQSLGLGRDTFTTEMLSRESTEQAVVAIRKFLESLEPYALPPESLRVVATSAVREARNGMEFGDRIYTATQARMEMLDEAETARLAYLAVREQVQQHSFFHEHDTLILEVGGGNTQSIHFRRGRVLAAHDYHVGSLRIERDLQGYQLSPRTEEILREYLAQPIEQLTADMENAARVSLVTLGSELRFAYQQRHPTWSGSELGRLETEELEAFTRLVLSMTPEETARRFSLGLVQTESMGPALYVTLSAAKALKLKNLYVAAGSLRHGVLIDLLGDAGWESEFRRQVASSTLSVARRYRADMRHARNVAQYAGKILTVLKRHFVFGERDDVVLNVAALLHEIGMFVNDRAYHKHTMYLIENSEIFGLSKAELRLAARLARYHRKATPKTSHDEYLDMSAEERICVSQLAGILRVANALDHLRPKRPFPLSVEVLGERLRLTVKSSQDLTLTRLHLAGRSEMFKAVFGLTVELRSALDLSSSYMEAET